MKALQSLLEALLTGFALIMGIVIVIALLNEFAGWWTRRFRNKNEK